MNKVQGRVKKLVNHFLVFICVFAVCANVTAQSKKQQPRKTPAMSESVFKELGKAAELASPAEDSGKQADFAGAMSAFKKIERNCADKCNKYEFASIYRYMGWVAYSLEDIPNATRYYKLVVDQSPEIPVGIELEALKTLAQLYFQAENYDQVVNYLEKYKALAPEVGSDIYYLTSTACYQKNDNNCAIKNIDIAVKMVEERGNVAQEQWYNLQRALYQNKEDYKTSLKILEKLLRHYPKKLYWTQLGAIYGILEREKNQLQAYDVSYLMGALDKEQQLLNLSYLYLGAEVPYRAAQILEKGMADKLIAKTEKNLELLGRSYYLAQEVDKAIPVMEQAASKSANGDLYAQLIAMYSYRDENKKALKAGENALKKGGLKRAGEVYLNMGQAHFELKEYDKAIEAFNKSAKVKETEKFALAWKTHAEREKFRSEQLAEAAKRVEAGGT